MGPVCAHCCSIPLSKPRASALAVSTATTKTNGRAQDLKMVWRKNSQHHSALLIARGRIRGFAPGRIFGRQRRHDPAQCALACRHFCRKAFETGATMSTQLTQHAHTTADTSTPPTYNSCPRAAQDTTPLLRDVRTRHRIRCAIFGGRALLLWRVAPAQGCRRPRPPRRGGGLRRHRHIIGR